jgi:DNA-binding NarL/FixJ family response regulator
MNLADTILIVEDLAPTRLWVEALMIELYPAAIVDCCANVREAMEWIFRHPTDAAPLCLIDLGLPDGSGTEILRALADRMPRSRAIVMTLYDDDHHVLDAMSAGAVGYLLKDQDRDIIRARILSMEHGEVPMSPAISRRILSLFRERAELFRAIDPSVSLTPRETDMLRLVGRGLSTPEAADMLEISAQTAAGYLKAVYRKLDVNTRAEAAVEAARRGLV